MGAHTPLDLTDEMAVREFLRQSPADACVNFAAMTEIEGCERERSDPAVAARSFRPGSAWGLNAELPRWVAESCERTGRFLVHLSSDAIFDGTRGPYPEATPPSPFSERLSWYGATKGAGEAAVFASKGPRAIVRVSCPFGSGIPGTTDLALMLLTEKRQGRVAPLFADQRITPTWVPDVSAALAPILERASGRIYHVASPEVTTPYEFARTLFLYGGWGTEGLSPASLASETPARGRAPRPLLGGLLVREVHKLDVRPRSFREGLRELLGTDAGTPLAAP